MVIISKKTEYAIILVSYLAESEEKRVSLAMICDNLKLPYRFLGQLAVELKKGGVLNAREGRGGGYNLRKGWQDISLYQLIEMLDENKALVECLHNDSSCNCSRENGCKLKKLWLRLERVFEEEIKKVKLGEIKV